jgi:cell division protein FtsI (penicillin-binding protein 3)
VAGKTGTALVADGNRGYADHIYQSSFAGYFPVENPQYTCIVVIKNRPDADVFYGAAIAGPVFKEIADRLYVSCVKPGSYYVSHRIKRMDSSYFNYKGLRNDVKYVMNTLKVSYNDSANVLADWINVNGNKGNFSFAGHKINGNTMPILKGLGLKDVIFLCENDMGLKVNIKGKGKVVDQSLIAGQSVSKGQTINVTLN